MLMTLYRLGVFFYKIKLKPLSKVIYYLQYFLCNSSVPHTVIIGKRTKFAYGGISTVIHSRACIGEDCVIGQGVTIGGRSKYYEVPRIGNNVYIGPGARLLGPIEIGDNSIIAPNAVVITDVNSETIVGGVPSRIIRKNITVSDYI